MEGFKSEGRYSGDKERAPLTGDRYERNDSPGTDSYDDGLGAHGKMVMPGSTVHESAPNYMEDKGPNDLRHTDRSGDAVLGELNPEITISDDLHQEISADRRLKNDAAAKWLRANDPEAQAAKQMSELSEDNTIEEDADVWSKENDAELR
jgi:hypothetical protein